ncbi:putative aspartyl-trna synthetase protein [Phaeoacremonium minimum UCRPA7]|uniref:Putative aspartyl-trna synthetase protein n=1 Tax=Phaeoacremonium minimum (strain UCR-PA7) TaxID=1286976 RepID=R8BN59_PHAM7|nr:putative aspartyl-trna synthetase protein [Phaeoacremonium minimum UCRPA7]EOO00767.1 putative aspartyl-trna synthetase protein [Phaeoacremonium minimum UCRPA7]
MHLIETVVRDLFKEITAKFQILSTEGELVPVRKEVYDVTGRETVIDYPSLSDEAFPRLQYDDAMALYGSDKPDLRIPNKICRVDSVLPKNFVSMISDVENPAIDACKFRLNGSIKENWAFVRELWDSLPTSLAKNPDGAPAVMVFDSSKPMCGLSALGHEAFQEITGDGQIAEALGDFEDGDILITQAREDRPFEGGSTALGNVRLAFYQAAVDKGLLERDDSFKFLWVVGFPLFTPNNDVDPGQGGASGFSSTHHPFTAPLTSKDFELLATDPLRVKADHYDLVLNGVELGGGSRRIHVAEVQEYVLRDILKMSDEGISHFSHLIEALRAGCPPHAGFAFGWDRLVATLSYTKSVRDVIAFPKNMKGEDMMAKSPLKVTPGQLSTYHLALKAK